MVGHLTIQKKAFTRLKEADRQRFLDAFERLGVIKQDLLPMIDKDTEAFEAVMTAFRLPKETELEQHRRRDAIQEANIGAIEVPLQVAILGMEALETLDVILRYGNKNAISDVGVAALQLQAGIQGASMNVKINLSMLDDGSVRRNYGQRMHEIERVLSNRFDPLIQDVEARL
jgi:formiminotetrahydrofolate cyclodeaminase